MKTFYGIAPDPYLLDCQAAREVSLEAFECAWLTMALERDPEAAIEALCEDLEAPAWRDVV